tara:strand:+ start:144534 stop:145004 length:471 start_codon:yes stop_codon:yes gene_type:complete
MTNTAVTESPVRDWMSAPLRTANQESTVRDVLEIMKQENVSSTPVIDPQGQVIGIVTLGDLARTVLSTDKLLESNYPHYDDCMWAIDLIQQRLGSDKVTSLMSENVRTIHPDQSMRAAARLMTESKISHLAVATDHEPLGMLSADDFVRFTAAMVD